MNRFNGSNVAMRVGILLVLGLFISASTSKVAAADSTRPNIVIIMVDDMGYEGVSCFGNPYFKTRNIDRLAAEGMRLTDFQRDAADGLSFVRNGLFADTNWAADRTVSAASRD